eukprot:1194704-Prorocentrum_minimum.AAC.2
MAESKHDTLRRYIRYTSPSRSLPNSWFCFTDHPCGNNGKGAHNTLLHLRRSPSLDSRSDACALASRYRAFRRLIVPS